MSELTQAEIKAIRVLKRLEKSWPETLWLYSASGSLCVMKKGPDGDRMRVGVDGSGIDPSASVETINIENDGGDW